VTEAARRFERDTGVAVKVTAAASNALAAQILAGAPGHVFLSANPPWAEEIEKQGDALEARDLLSNRLVIVVPSGNPAGVRSPRDLLGDRVTHVALAGEKVPAGLYAEQALRHAEVYEALVSRGRVARGQDVRLTLGFVETGEAQAGVVYATDARASDDVDVVHTFDPRTHERIVYPLVLLEGARARPAARRLYDFLRGAEAMAVFETHGFSPAGSQPRATTD
jgi:molybdate transport system substrate-binding protein